MTGSTSPYKQLPLSRTSREFRGGREKEEERKEEADSADYRATKAWERGNKYERVKPLDGIQLVKIQPGQRRSGQAGSESGTGVGRTFTFTTCSMTGLRTR
jgi:hypothetical protein